MSGPRRPREKTFHTDFPAGKPQVFIENSQISKINMKEKIMRK